MQIYHDVKRVHKSLATLCRYVRDPGVCSRGRAFIMRYRLERIVLCFRLRTTCACSENVLVGSIGITSGVVVAAGLMLRHPPSSYAWWLRRFQKEKMRACPVYFDELCTTTSTFFVHTGTRGTRFQATTLITSKHLDRASDRWTRTHTSVRFSKLINFSRQR